MEAFDHLLGAFDYMLGALANLLIAFSLPIRHVCPTYKVPLSYLMEAFDHLLGAFDYLLGVFALSFGYS